MKRSEMINIVKDVLLNLEAPETEEQLNANLETLLSKIEEAGMAPPEVAEPVETGVCIMTPMGFETQRTETSKVFVRKWEE